MVLSPCKAILLSPSKHARNHKIRLHIFRVSSPVVPHFNGSQVRPNEKDLITSQTRSLPV